MPMDFVRALRTMFVHTTRPQQDGRDNPAAFDWTALGEGVSSVFFAGAPGADGGGEGPGRAAVTSRQAAFCCSSLA